MPEMTQVSSTMPENYDALLERFTLRLQDTGLVWKYLEKMHCILVCLSSFVIVLAISATVIMRYVLDTNLFGIEEWILLASFVLYFMGGAQGSFERSHICADFLEKFMVRRGWIGGYLLVQRGLELIINYFFVYWGYLMLSWSITRWPMTTVWKIPFAAPQSFIALGFVLMALYNTVQYIHVIRTICAMRREGSL